jgi:undecaprenyl-diphosphatase
MMEQLRQVTSVRRRPLAASIAAAGALVLLLLFDRPLLEAIASTYSPVMQPAIDMISELRGIVSGLIAGLIVLAAGYALGRDRLRRAGLLMLLSVIASGVMVGIMKPIIGRTGPAGSRQSNTREAGLNIRWGRFPSGHTAAAFSAASGLARVFPATAPVGYGLGLLVAYERTYRGIHYPSDCFAGALVGLLATVLVARWLRTRPGWRDPGPPRCNA